MSCKKLSFFTAHFIINYNYRLKAYAEFFLNGLKDSGNIKRNIAEKSKNSEHSLLPPLIILYIYFITFVSPCQDF